MTRRWTRTVVGLSLVMTACSGTGPSARTANSVIPATTGAGSSAVAAPAGGGRLVVVDGAGDIVTMRPDGSQRQALTDDGDAVGYWQPLWSPVSNDLVWAEVTDAGFAIVVSDGTDALSIPMPALPFFSMWSPDGSRIGVLHNAAGGELDLEVVDAATGATTTAAGAAPYFFAWSPDGSQILRHVGGRELGLVDSNGITRLASTDGDFQAPLWNRAGIFHFGDGSLLTRETPEGEPRPVATVAGPGTMVAAPGGGRIAVQVIGPGETTVFAALQLVPEIPLNAVVVLDPVTGDIEVASGRTSFGYFWSPDGTSLLILVPALGEGELEWWVWRDGEIITRLGFVPTAGLVRDLLPFFDQYAQAWSPWAPDSSAFAFVGTIDRKTGVWVRELDSEEPRFLSDGDWVAWSAR